MPVTRPAHGHSLKLKLGCAELVRIFQCVGTNMGSHLRRDVSTLRRRGPDLLVQLEKVHELIPDHCDGCLCPSRFCVSTLPPSHLLPGFYY